MVRISSRASRRRTNLLAEQYRKNKGLYGRHSFHLLLLCIITLCGSLYFFLLQRDVNASGEAQQQQQYQRREQQQQQQQHHHYQQNQQADHQAEEQAEGYDDQQEAEEGAGQEGYEEEEENENGEENLEAEENEEGIVDFSEILPASKVLELGLPFLVYGTAWKKHETSRYVQEAIRAGFRFIDTACQPKHYNEPQVGEGWVQAAQDLGLERDDLFLQTKFSSYSGQDPDTSPFEPSLSLEDQVWKSLDVSLENLQTDYLDSWIMHGPETTLEKTMEVYRVMEQAYDDNKVKRLGISNCYNVDMFKSIYEQARVKPEVLQNRFVEQFDWDQELRAFCQANDIWYQSFWTLTGNREALRSPEAVEWAESKGLPGSEQLIYAYLMSSGYGTPLDGTTDWEHMEQDIALMQRIQREELNQSDEDKIFESSEDIKSFERLLGF